MSTEKRQAAVGHHHLTLQRSSDASYGETLSMCDVPKEMHDYRRRLQIELEALDRTIPDLTEEKISIVGEVQYFDNWASAHRQRCPECRKQPFILKFRNESAIAG
jgi:hypothetical protein